MNEIVEIHKKMFYYLDTFTNNSGREVAKNIILDTLKKDAVEAKMRSVRNVYESKVRAQAYEESARAYYNKYGTAGEF